MTVLTDLLDSVRTTCAGLPDKRRGRNVSLSMADIGMAGFSVFFMQSPSFLAHQRQLEEGQGRSNCQTLLNMKAIPSDNHVRAMLDAVTPCNFDDLFDQIVATVEKAAALPKPPGLAGHNLIALDGTQYFCSDTLSCQHCSTRKRGGASEYYHTMVAASIVAPGHNRALPLMAEFVHPQDGHDKQDCESRAARRWLSQHGRRFERLNPIYLGDDLYANQPLCQTVKDNGGHFIFVCKPDSHKTLYEYLQGVELASQSVTLRRGKQQAVHSWRWINDLPIRDGKDALGVNWFELTIKDQSGKITYRNAFITDLTVRAENVADLASAGRARWKIENETFNVLKTKGYNLEHNFGHGSRFLAATLATLNLLAFAIHTAAELADIAWKKAFDTAKTRLRFFNHIRTLTTYMVFPSWTDLLKTLAFEQRPPHPP